MDRGAWQASVHRATKELDTTERLNNNKKFLWECRQIGFTEVWIEPRFYSQVLNLGSTFGSNCVAVASYVASLSLSFYTFKM